MNCQFHYYYHDVNYKSNSHILFCNLPRDKDKFYNLIMCCHYNLISVCNAGYHKTHVCVLCPENKIKIQSGNASDCNVDSPCNGINMVSNTEHTACGKL